MYTLLDCDAAIEGQFKAAAEAARALADGLTASESGCTIPAQTDLAAVCRGANTFYKIREGHVPAKISGKLLYFYSDGDLIGFDIAFGGAAGSEMISEFAVIADKFRVSDFVSAAALNAGLLPAALRYLSAKLALVQLFAARLLKEDVALSPEIKYFQKGEMILQRGGEADKVYTLVDGGAEAFIDGIKVGEIGPDQLFGVMAVVTGAPRTADVIAAKKSMVAAVPKERFIELVQNRPGTVLKLIEDLARTIISLNEQVVRLRKAGI